MEDVSLNYYSLRSQKARLGWLLRGPVGKSLLIVGLLLVAAGLTMLLTGLSFGWVLVGVSSIPLAVHSWNVNDLRHLTSGKGGGIDDVLSGDILGQLPKNPTPFDIATAVGRVSSGQFMGARFGLTPALLQQIASHEASDTPKLLKKARVIMDGRNSARITGSVMVAALVRSFPSYESLIAQIHLDDSDLDAGIDWEQHLRNLVAKHSQPRRTGGIARDWSFGFTPLLGRFGRNVSEQLSRGGGAVTVDISSHNEAIERLVETFANGGRQNAVLVGKEGVGKTTIIQAFADRLLDANSSLPGTLKFRQVVILDSASLIAAAPGRGELEDLVMRVLTEAYSAKNIIICLDNAQLFFEEGVGAVDVTNVLQPILEAGNVRMILSMDEQRFLRITRRNPSFANSLNRINIAPADRAESMRVLEEQIVFTEMRQKVTYMYQALKEAYRLSERYVHDLDMPGRAMKLAESAASYHESGLVTINSVQQAIEKTLDVKVSVASDTEDRQRLLNMEQLIHERMVNQTRAVQVVSDALRRARAGVRNQNRPIGTFLFLGPTGVGKTELSKALSEVYFGGEGKLIRVDLNEYVQASDVNRLIADGADDPTSLTAQVMKQPFSVILLDEIEKAAPEVLATLLQLLDEGILRDIKNREISFRDAIIIATSNAGADRIREYIERGYKIEQFEQQFTNELISAGQFRPEFLNRFDEIVVFRPFTPEELLKVLDMILNGVNKTLELQKISVAVDDDAKRFLVDKGYDPRLGARPMRRVVQKAVENTVAKKMLAGDIGMGDSLHITLEDVQRVYESSSALTEPVSD